MCGGVCLHLCICAFDAPGFLGSGGPSAQMPYQAIGATFVRVSAPLLNHP